jgi:hypothetical protein
MTRLDHAPEIIDLARQLGIQGNSPVRGILEHCHRRVVAWVAEAGGLADIDAVESLVTSHLQMVFEEIREEEDFDRITEVYARQKKDPVFATMRMRFNDEANPTFGTLIRRRNTGSDSLDRYVAVIDCRGEKLARRFFTRWHEIAHRLTTHADGGDTEPAYRSEHDPIEQMMDEIAGHIGFYEAIFGPTFRQAVEQSGLLKFGTVQRIIETAFSAASFQSTLFACTRRIETPVLYLEATLAHKKEVQRRLATPSLFGDPPPPGELRAVMVRPNAVAQDESFIIPRNMRVPADSIIHQIFGAELLTDGSADENLSQWESQGRSLPSRRVFVEARKVPDRVIAIVQPT